MKRATDLATAAVLGALGLWLIREAVARTVEWETERYMRRRG